MDPVRTVEENLRVAMACYARVSEDGGTRSYPGLVVTSSGVDIAVFNSAMLTEPATRSQLERAAHLASLHFKSKSLGWSMWLCDDLIPAEIRASCRSFLQERGLVLVARPPGMCAEQLNIEARGAAGIDCRPIADERTRLDFAHISSMVFALPFVSAKRIYCDSALWEPPMRGWVGYVNGKAVSVVTTVIAAGAVGVYSLGTLPQNQGCGYGQTLLRHAIEEARRETGITRSVLQSTDDGFNLYLRMGYRVVTSFSVFTKEACS
jgi:ribosomal protein S18 acetylase RimI-like enzyme